MRLGRRVVVFDLDDTIYDRTFLRIGNRVREIRIPLQLRLSDRQLLQQIEQLTRSARAFQRIGFPNLRHQADPGVVISLLALLYSRDSSFLRRNSIDMRWQARTARTLGKLRQIGELGANHWQEALRFDLAYERVVCSSEELDQLRHLSRTVRSDRLIAEIALDRPPKSVWRAYEGFREAWSGLTQNGVECVIGSEGEERRQRVKLRRLGLGRRYCSRLLTTERTANPSGARELRRLVQSSVRQFVREHHLENALSMSGDGFGRTLLEALPLSLTSLYPFVWVLNHSVSKSPAFYARILNALAFGSGPPGKALDAFRVMSSAEWRSSTISVASVGDNYLKDIAPLRRLLGPRRVWGGLLTLGPYGSKSGARARTGVHVFPSWQGLCKSLVAGGVWKQVDPVERSPRLVGPLSIEARLLHSSMHSGLPLVRRMAKGLLENQA